MKGFNSAVFKMILIQSFELYLFKKFYVKLEKTII